MATTARQRKRISLIIQASIFVVVVLVLIFTVNWSGVRESFFKFENVGPMFPQIVVPGLLNTLFYATTSFGLGLVLGLFFALMRMSSFPPYRWIATGYIELFRGLPALLVLAAVGFGVPLAFPSANIPTWVSVMIGLGIVSAAYMAETIRAGIEAVPPGQLEAARSLGMSQTRAMFTIVIPQALRIVLPPLTNEFILLVKDSSLAFAIGLALNEMELTAIGRASLLPTRAGLTALVVAGFFYLCITIPLGFLVRWFEKRTSQSSRKRSPKPANVTTPAGATA